MNPHPHPTLLAIALVVFVQTPCALAKPTSDLVSPEHRRGAVQQALQLARPAPLAALSASLPQPFNPPGFEQADSEEVRALAVAQAAAATVATPAKPATDRELLVHIAARIQPSGTFRVGDSTFLLFGQKRLRPGDILTISYDGHDYQLELAAIDQSTFTLRLNQEEYTRPLKSGKNP